MEHLCEKAKPIRLLILDVDGVLTSGVIYYGIPGEELKGFHVHDGLGIKLLQKCGVEIALLSAKESSASMQRAQSLHIKHIYLGHTNKLPIYEKIKQSLHLNDNEIAYMGDDLPDLPILQRVGFAITVPQAPAIIKQHADLITRHKAGKGAVREACEFILEAQNQLQTVIQSYLKEYDI